MTPRFWTDVPLIDGAYWDGVKLYDREEGCWFREGRLIDELLVEGAFFYGPLPTSYDPAAELDRECEIAFAKMMIAGKDVPAEWDKGDECIDAAERMVNGERTHELLTAMRSLTSRMKGGA